MGFNDEYAGCVVFDLETVASPDVAALLDPVKAPSNYKDPIKIAAYQDEKRAEIVSRAALEADLCEIVAIGWSDDKSIHAFTRSDANEVWLIEALWASIGIKPIIGFNVLGFDLPVLIRRTQLLGLPVPYVNLDRYRTPHIDLLEKLTFNGRLTMRSLSFYCRRFGIPSADTTTGADIAGLVAASDWSAVLAHVEADIVKTVALAQKLGYRVGQPEGVL